jgi:hypothetical protein
VKGPDARYQHLSTAGQGHWRIAVSQSSLSLHLESQTTASPVPALCLMPEPMPPLVPTIRTSDLALSLGLELFSDCPFLSEQDGDGSTKTRCTGDKALSFGTMPFADA